MKHPGEIKKKAKWVMKEKKKTKVHAEALCASEGRQEAKAMEASALCLRTGVSKVASKKGCWGRN